jgi:hypothetical protein
VGFCGIKKQVISIRVKLSNSLNTIPFHFNKVLTNTGPSKLL